MTTGTRCGDPEKPADDDAERLRRELRASEDEVARLRLEVWELRDALIGSAAQERPVKWLLAENDRIRYLMRRPWRALGGRAKVLAKDVWLRVDGRRTGGA